MKDKQKGIKAYQHRNLTHKGRQQERNKGTTKHVANNKMALVCPYRSIITLSVNGLSSPIRRHRVAGWIKKTRL